MPSPTPETGDNLSPVAGNRLLSFVEGDITDLELVEVLMPGHDVVVHFAAESHVDRSILGATNNYGPYQFPEKVIPLFVTNLLDAGTVPPYGDGLNIRDWLHVDDHCSGTALALAKGRAGEVYHIGGGTELTNRELTEKLLAVCGGDWDSVVPVKDRRGHDRRYSLDISKIGDELGYQPSITLDAGLAATEAWYRDNRAWWEPLKSRATLCT